MGCGLGYITLAGHSSPLVGRALEICRQRAARYPEGAIFRNRAGRSWRGQGLVEHFGNLSRLLGFRVIAYSLRHTYATDAIVNGVDVITLAEIMGHSDLTMLQQVYQHINQRSEHIRVAAERATAHLR